MLPVKPLSFILLVFLVGCARSASGDSKAAIPDIVIEVSAKQLLEEPNKYADKTVHVSGYWVRGFEWSNFSASADDRTSEIWLNAFLAPPNSPVEIGLKKAYTAAGMEWPRMNIRAFITCEGLFEHRKFSIDERTIGPGFGHLGHYHSQLSISKLIKVKPMTDLEYASPR